MKRLILITACFIAIFIVSCDKVKSPIVNNGTPAPTPTAADTRKILVEDYTGMKCGNCPPAAVTAENLATQYPGRIITIAVHAGSFSNVQPPNFPTSYTTQAGNDWDGNTGFAISAGAGNPNGMINRKDYGSGIIEGPSAWPGSVSVALNDVYILKLTLTPTYDAASRNLNTTVKAKFKNTYANNTVVTLVLAEDSIIGNQKDYTKNPDVVQGYVFNSMLRGSINGSWGTVLKNTPINANDSVSVSFNNFTINSAFNDKHVYLIGFVSDATTKEVLQVERVKIR